MRYRLLELEEWGRLAEIVDHQFIPDSSNARAAIAEDESGKITGVLFLQMVVHMEPLVLTSPKVNFKRLYELLYNAVSENKGFCFYAFSGSDIIDRMAEHVGMRRMPYDRIFIKEVT